MTSHSNDLLSIKNLCRYYTLYGEKRTILYGLNLEIGKGEFIGIAGSSGSGKTTLLNIISGIDRCDGGEIFFNGTNILDFSEKKLASFRNLHIGIVFQQYHILSEFNVIENVLIPAWIKGTSKAKAHKRALSLLQSIGIADKKNYKIGEISGGEMQRVAIARAMINNPSLILADEPTGNLDGANANLIFNLLKDLCKEKKTAVLFVSHTSQLIDQCQRYYTLNGGTLSLEKMNKQ